jgi:uncharacterized protein YktA (UPF0223 family)
MSDKVEIQIYDEEGEKVLFDGNILSEEQEGEISNFLLTEIESVMEDGDERAEFLESVKKWQRQREARPESKVKNFPWEKSSNVEVTTTLTNTNAITASVLSALADRKPFWSVVTAHTDMQKKAKGLTELMENLRLSKQHMNFNEANRTVAYETVSIGTHVVKVPWVKDKYRFKTTVEGGVQEKEITRVNSPKMIPIEIENFLVRTYNIDLQRAPWVGHLVWLYKHELEQRGASGIYDVDKVKMVLERGEDDLTETMKKRMENMGFDPKTDSTKLYSIFEGYIFWDVDGDGVSEDIKIWFDPISGAILRSEYNDLGVRDYVPFWYFKRPFQFYGMGVGWVMEHVQDEITTLHNIAINNAQLASSKMMIKRRGSAVPAGAEIRPAGIIEADDPMTDIREFGFSDISSNVTQREMMAKELGDRATGASDAMLGFESRSTSARTTATGTMFLAKQGSKLLTSNITNMEESYSNVGEIVLFQLVKNKDEIIPQIPKLVSEEFQQDVIDFFNEIELEQIPQYFTCRVKTSDLEETKEAKRQARLSLNQLYMMYGEKALNYLMMASSPDPNVSPPLKEYSLKLYLGLSNMMEETFKDFSEFDTNSYLPYIKDLEAAVAEMERQKAGGMNGMSEGQAEGGVGQGFASGAGMEGVEGGYSSAEVTGGSEAPVNGV